MDSLAFEIMVREAIYLLIARYFLLALLGLIGIISVLFFVPLHYKLDAAWDQMPDKLNLSVRNCLYGISFNWKSQTLNWYLLFVKRSINLDDKGTVKQQSEKPYRQSLKTFFHPLLNMARDLEFRETIRRLAINLWRVIRPQQMTIKVWIGFDEPHYTGWLMGILGILQSLNHVFKIDVTGVWHEPCFKGELKASGRISPARLFGQVIIFIMHPKIRPAIRQLHLTPAQ
ncbi:Protein of unknown function DUF2953 [Syntrophomonas zehnderi OL-4]|uniref:DUF2953 domain-containing protein n=1 Tax=Syntrophomonas zehnderi OL-4 TaxID=690567 RepID=A0A0E3W2I3_9FIRM|nr:hypothetical protein [Syntrophomonas zehnderi]CFX02055.1 Protein of unknown function DUF2953 [Syntrophomonas zehnderi OL-4]